MPTLIELTVPLCTFLIMFAVGTSLGLTDFRAVASTPRVVLLPSLTRLIVLPLAGVVVVELLPLNQFVVAGVLLIAACPAGSIANLYVYLARANVALTVVLTGSSCLAAIVTMPLVMHGFASFVSAAEAFQTPVVPLLRSLLLFLLLPVLLGMLLRHSRPDFVIRHDRWLRGGSLLLVAALIAQILGQAPDAFARDLDQTLLASVMMAGLAILAGALLARWMRLDTADFWAVTISTMAQNIALAMTIAVTVYRQPRFATFAVAYFLVQVPIAAGMILVCRWRAGCGRLMMPAPRS